MKLHLRFFVASYEIRRLASLEVLVQGVAPVWYRERDRVGSLEKKMQKETLLIKKKF